MRVGAERVLGHERLARPLHELLHQLLLALERMGGDDGLDALEQLLAHASSRTPGVTSQAPTPWMWVLSPNSFTFWSTWMESGKLVAP